MQRAIDVLWLGALGGIFTTPILVLTALLAVAFLRAAPPEIPGGPLGALAALVVTLVMPTAAHALVSLIMAATPWANSTGRGVGRDRAVNILGLVSAVVVVAYGLLWLFSAVRPDASGRKLSELLWLTETLVLGTISGRLILSLLRAALARAVDRRRRGTMRSGQLGVIAAYAVALALSLTAALVAFGGGGGAAPSGDALALSATPARHVILVAIDGVQQRQLRYWLALKQKTTIKELWRNGAVAGLPWPAERGDAAWMHLTTGIEDEQELRERQETGAEGSLRAGIAPFIEFAFPLRRGVRSTALDAQFRRPPGIADLVARLDEAVDLLGWPGAEAPDAGRCRFVRYGAYEVFRDHLKGKVAVGWREGTTSPSELFYGLTSYARAPWRDWRAGGQVTPLEDEVIESSLDAKVSLQVFLRDRFYLNVFKDVMMRSPGRLAMLYLDYPRSLTAELGLEQGPEPAMDRAVYAYLDYLDRELGKIRASLPSGSTLAVLLAPAGEFASAATILLFGEKIAPGVTLEDPLEIADLTLTLLYLAGVRPSMEIAGDVAWGMLSPTIREHFPPIRLRSYGELPAEGGDGRGGGRPR